MEVLRASPRPERRPGRKRVRRRPDSEVRLTLPSARNLGERLGVDRRDVDEGRVAPEALAADEVLRRDLDAFDDRSSSPQVLTSRDRHVPE
jgi:hypothetical protein